MGAKFLCTFSFLMIVIALYPATLKNYRCWTMTTNYYIEVKEHVFLPYSKPTDFSIGDEVRVSNQTWGLSTKEYNGKLGIVYYVGHNYIRLIIDGKDSPLFLPSELEIVKHKTV